MSEPLDVVLLAIFVKEVNSHKQHFFQPCEKQLSPKTCLVRHINAWTLRLIVVPLGCHKGSDSGPARFLDTLLAVIGQIKNDSCWYELKPDKWSISWHEHRKKWIAKHITLFLFIAPVHMTMIYGGYSVTNQHIMTLNDIMWENIWWSYHRDTTGK